MDLDRVILEQDTHDKTSLPHAKLISVDRDGKIGTPAFWNRSGFRHFRINNSNNKEAIGTLKIKRMSIYDGQIERKVFVDVTCEVWCDPGMEEQLIASFARHTRNFSRPMDHVIEELVEDWTLTHLGDKERKGSNHSFLLSLLPNAQPQQSVVDHLQRQARIHLHLGLSATFDLSDLSRATPVSIGPIRIEAFPSGLSKRPVTVSLRADLRTKENSDDQIRALATVRDAPSFEKLLREETTRTIESEVSLDDLVAVPPKKARQAIEDSLNKKLASYGRRVLHLDLSPDLGAALATTELVQTPFTFQLHSLDRKWTGTISFNVNLDSHSVFVNSGVSSAAQWAHKVAEDRATRLLSSYSYEPLLEVYATLKSKIEEEIRDALREIGHSINGFNLTTNLPIEQLIGPRRTPERREQFETRIPQCRIELTYFVEYHIPDLAKFRVALAQDEDIPDKAARLVDQTLKDELRQTDPLDIYFNYGTPGKATSSIEQHLLQALRNKLNDAGFRIRNHLLRREDDEVFRKITRMMEPARQGKLEPFEIYHPQLDPASIVVRTLVFRVTNFSRENFYLFVFIKPEIEQIADSVRTHLQQFLVDADPAYIFRLAASELRDRFNKYALPRIDSEFGVKIQVQNLVLEQHENVASPGPLTSPKTKELKMWQGILEGLQEDYALAVRSLDAAQQDALENQIEKASTKIQDLQGDLRRSETETKTMIAQSGKHELLLSAGLPVEEEDEDRD